MRNQPLFIDIKEFCFWKIKQPTSYIGLGIGPLMTTAPFEYKGGEQQGTNDSIPLLTFGIDDINNLTNDELRAHGGNSFIWSR